MAMDNCAGVAVVLALSQPFTPAMRTQTEFVLFGAEELGWGRAGTVRQRSPHLTGLKASSTWTLSDPTAAGLKSGRPPISRILPQRRERNRCQGRCLEHPSRAASDQRFVENGFSAI
jgi:hypothetical protein